MFLEPYVIGQQGYKFYHGVRCIVTILGHMTSLVTWPWDHSVWFTLCGPL